MHAAGAIVRAVTRKLTATTGVLLALVFAGCGKDEPSDTAAQSAATTTPTATTPAATTSGSKASKSASKTTTTSKSSDAQATTGSTPKTSTSAGSKKSSGTTSTGSATTPKTKTKKKTTTAQTPVGVTPGAGSGAGSDSGSGEDPSSGTGAGPAQERQEVVTVLRRYYKAFIDKDGESVCALLTSGGREIMIRDGGEKTCAASAERLVAQAGKQNITLLETTRDGLHVDDITVKGNNAIAQIGETSRLRLVQENGRWLVRSPDVTTGSQGE